MSCRTCKYSQECKIPSTNTLGYTTTYFCTKENNKGTLVNPDDICDGYEDKYVDGGIFDPVSKPSHYAAGRKYEPKDVIRDWDLNFNLGNAVKYISRAGRKNDLIEDLKKARQYLDFEIEYLEKKFGERF